jgi:cytochrome P450
MFGARMSSDGPLPPGRLGLPYLGETLAILRNPFGFVEERRERYGDVFKSRVLGRDTVFLGGTTGAEAFYDPANVGRSDAHPYPIVDLFGGVNLEMYDGARHAALKAMALEAFDDDAIASYLPGIERLVASRLEGWASQPEFGATGELRRLAIEAICLNLLGLQPGATTDAVCRDYGRVLKGIVSPPLAIPGTPYGRARAARNRLLRAIRGEIASHRAELRDDGLSRLLAAQADDGRRYTDDEAALEVHHIVIAGFIVYALMAEAMRRLAQDPTLEAACRAEVSGGEPLTVEALRRLQACTRVVMEAKRLVPLVPLAFGKAERTFSCDGLRVPKGWRVYLALRLCNLDPDVYRQPERFDPDRFAPGRAEHRAHPLAFIPQGAPPPTAHQCLGLEYSTFLVLAFLAVLLRDYEWDVPAQDLTYRWNTIPPEPRDGLRIRLRGRRR